VLDLVQCGVITTPFIDITHDLVDLNDLFNLYWHQVVPLGQTSSIAFPFSRLNNEAFWEVVPLPGHHITPAVVNNTVSVTYLRKCALGARVDEALLEIMQCDEGRDALREALLLSCFSPDAQLRLREQAVVNGEAFNYARILEARSHLPLVEKIVEAENVRPPVRDQAFRQLIVTVYDHRCAICGVRIITPEQYTAVEAAHIIPWCKSKNDDIRNGMALCRLCHWAFDNGMLGVSDNYQVSFSPHISSQHNAPGFLLTLTGRSIIGPADREIWPAKKYLAEHRHQHRL
jgi:putative restriction endonuclease